MTHILNSLCFISAGAPFLLLGLALFWRGVRLNRNGVRVVGTVVDYVTDAEGDGKFPVIQFTDLNGISHRRKLSWSGELSIGQSMNLVYAPDHPDVVSGTSAGELFFWPTVICLLGGITLFIGVGTLAGVISM